MAKIVKDYKFLSWQDIEQLSLTVCYKILDDGYKPESLIGLLRGGVVPARIFSDFFDILLEFYALDVKLYNAIGIKNSEARIKPFNGNVKGKKILIVDDIWDSGMTMNAVLNHFQGEDIVTSTLLWKKSSPTKPNYYAEVVKDNEWIVFPWEKREFDKEIRDKG